MKYKIFEILKRGKLVLRDHGIEVFALEAELLLAKLVCQNSRERLLALSDSEVDGNIEKEFFNLIERRIQNEPISQILGKKEFWDYEFIVDSSVLTPRNDTETIIEQVIKYFSDKEAELNILDLGTGSGCLSVTLAAIFSNAKITAIDISPAALKIAKQNAVKNIVDNRIAFIKSDWFSKVSKRTYDIIVCNPPYISINELKELANEVKDFEPQIALTDFADGYTYYKIIADEMRDYLKQSGKAFFEIGIDQALSVKEIFELQGYRVENIAKDLAGIERCVVIS
ncbi:peptide chain release factor N(5)-glutamine methyltransferase [Holosporaceae bacterium 'Namur']|nr:peptide chain release factor N(5)-glutamine methyltransferase [Holosporaceae bacterium 'Namur']